MVYSNLPVATPCALYCPYETKLVSTQKTKGKVYFIIALHGLNLISKAAWNATMQCSVQLLQ